MVKQTIARHILHRASVIECPGTNIHLKRGYILRQDSHCNMIENLLEIDSNKMKCKRGCIVLLRKMFMHNRKHIAKE